MDRYRIELMIEWFIYLYFIIYSIVFSYLNLIYF